MPFKAKVWVTTLGKVKNFVVLSLDFVQPCWENFSSDLQRNILHF
jgi:hypothetical protein